MCCAAAPLFVLIGCQTAPTGSEFGPTAQVGMDDTLLTEEQKELEEIKQILAQLGPNVSSDLKSLRDMLERQQEHLHAKAGPPDLVQDLWPTQRVLSQVIQTAQLKKVDETLKGLERLQLLIANVAGGLPAREIMARSERALAYLSEDALDRAYAELGVAYDIADRSSFPRLVPEGVASLIQTSARSQISAGRTQEAASVVDTVRRRCAEHESLKKFDRIASGLEGARDAVHREAWGVVEAELFEIHNEITGLAETLRIDQWGIAPRPADEAPAPAETPAEDAAEVEDAAEAETAAPPAEPEEAPEAAVEAPAAPEAPAEAPSPFRRR